MKIVKVLAACAVIGILGACSTIQGFFSSPAAAPIIAASVDIAVATAEQKGITAVQINTIAKTALAADAGASATVATVGGVASAAIAKLNLPAGDAAAAAILLAALEGVVQAKIQGNANIAVAPTDVATVLKDVIAATGG